MNKKRIIVGAGCMLAVLTVGTFWHNHSKLSQANRNLSDEALLALIKNDQKGFEAVIEAGVDIHQSLPVIDGQSFSIAEGLSYFDRAHFMRYLNQNKISYVKQKVGNSFDIVSLSIPKDNPELMNELLTQKPEMKFHYGDKGWTLMHMASASCAHKVVPLLHEKGGLKWDVKAKNGQTALTLAAESECLPVLGYWKEKGADFNARDGKGMSALAILRKKKSAALMAFAESFNAARSIASTPAKEPDFYRKRKIPKDQIVDHSALIEPDERPLDSVETAEFSEFSD